MSKRKTKAPPDDDGENEGFLSLGYFETEREAGLAYDRAMILIHGEDIDPSELNYDPSESESVGFPLETIRQINALRDGRGAIH